MANYTVRQYLNLIDIAIIVYGSTQFLFKLATDNNLSIDSDVEIGTVLNFDESIGEPIVKNALTISGVSPSNNLEIPEPPAP